MIYRFQKKYRIAEKYFLKNQILLKRTNNKITMADNELELAYLYRDWGKKDQAIQSFSDALALFNKRNAKVYVKKIKNELEKLNCEI